MVLSFTFVAFFSASFIQFPTFAPDEVDGDDVCFRAEYRVGVDCANHWPFIEGLRRLHVAFVCGTDPVILSRRPAESV